MWRVASRPLRRLCTSSREPPAERTTHFGYTTVPEADKERLVGDVFHNVASRYDVMNDLMSAGVHRVWKDTLVGQAAASARGSAGLQCLDVAGGTGDVAFRLARELTRASSSSPPPPPAGSGSASTEPARIVVSDINTSMLEEGRRRADAMPSLSAPHAPRIEWVPADARKLPFEAGSFDLYTIAFGIRNVTVIEEALAEAHRVLRPGGRFLCLEFSHVTNPLLAAAYERYSFGVIPWLGEVVTADRASYQYLVESIRNFPKQDDFAQMMREAGLRSVSYTNLTFGTVAIHSGFKL